MGRVPDAKGLMTKHLHDEELLAHLDGELTYSEKLTVASHLQSCWDCRTRLNDLQNNIQRLIEIRKSLPGPNAYGTAEMRVEQFRSRLMRHAEETRAAFSWWKRCRSVFQHSTTTSVMWIGRHRQPALALLVAFCLVLTMFTDVWTTRLSAETILLKAQNFETIHEAPSGSVLKSSLRIEKIERATDQRKKLKSVTVFRESQPGAVLIRTEGANNSKQTIVDLSNKEADNLEKFIFGREFADPVAQFLRAVQWVPDLAPSELRKILSARDSSINSVQKTDGIWEVHFPFSSGHTSTISEAIYAVRATDFAPQRLSLFAVENGAPVEYRFTQAEFEIQPRNKEFATLLSSSAVPSRLESSNSSVAPHILPLTYANSLASESEVSLASALHQADACLGDEIYIFPMSDGSLLLQGLVDSARRRDVLRRAVKSVSGPLAFEIYLPRELKRSTQLLPPPDSLSQREQEKSQTAVVTTLADLSDQRVPLHDVLYRHFSAQGLSGGEAEQQVNAFSNEVVTLARQTFLHAWALKRLEREFSKTRTIKLSPEAVSLVDTLRADHRRWIETLSHKQAQALGTIVDSDPTKSLSASPLPDADTLLQLAQEQNDLVRALFTTSSRQSQTSVDVSRLLAVLKKMGA
jgi:hypothetical protein